MRRKIFGVFIIFVFFSIIPMSYAQISFSDKAVQESVEVFINSEGNVHVKHVVKASKLPKQVDLIYGTVLNLVVTNEDKEEKQFSVIGDNSGVIISPSDKKSIIEYDLEHVLTEKEKVWTWSFRYLETTSFYLPEGADLIFANERPVFLDNKKGITCHGCQMLLEYSIDEPKIFKNVKWEDKEFVVEILSYSDIEGFSFNQPAKNISFDVSEKDRFVTTVIPLELLWGPYVVSLNDEKILHHSYVNNGTHVWLNIRPDSSGEISITGTTVVPEFPLVAPLAIGFLMIVILPMIRKINLH